jgi:hypothetical protein
MKRSRQHKIRTKCRSENHASREEPTTSLLYIHTPRRPLRYLRQRVSVLRPLPHRSRHTPLRAPGPRERSRLSNNRRLRHLSFPVRQRRPVLSHLRTTDRVLIFGAFPYLEVILSTRSEQARGRAEASFRKKQEQVRERDEAMMEYEAAARAVLKNTARLRALRLAKEAAEATAKTTTKPRTAAKKSSS